MRLGASALAVALVATLITTTNRPDNEVEAAPDDAFPLSVERPDLAHVADHDLTVEVGVQERRLARGAGRTVSIGGSPGRTGSVRVVDENGRLAGLAMVPKDDVALLGLHDDGPLDVVVDYRTTAFAVFASQPGLLSSEPTVTVLIAALVAGLPEFEAFAATLERDAGEDPAYLEHLSDEALRDLDALVAAFRESAAAAIADVGVRQPDPTTTVPPTTVPLRAPTQEQDDPDGCDPPEVENVIVVDLRRQDYVCLTEATFNGTAWEVQGRSATPRWAVARPINRGTTAEEIGFIPGKALAIPELADLAIDLANTVATAGANWFENYVIDMCDSLASLVRGGRPGAGCDADRPNDVAETFIAKAESYFSDAQIDLVLDGSERETVMAVNGVGFAGGDASGNDIVTSFMVTFTMTMVAPAIELLVDLPIQNFALKNVDPDLIKALEDTAASLAPDIWALGEGLRTGGLTDRLGTLVTFTKKALGAALDEGLVEAVMAELFLRNATNAVTEAIASLAERLGAAPLAWINTAIDVLNAGVTLLMLAQDLDQLATSARYALGYESLPPLEVGPDAEPVEPVAHDPLPNPGLPGDSCGVRVALVLDRSTSIRDAGQDAMEQVRNAATGLIDALGNTPSSVRITAFGTWPTLRQGWTSLASAAGRQETRQAASNVEFARGDSSGSTNWEAALADVQGQDADLVVLVTDGNPTSFGSGMESRGPLPASIEFDPSALAAGVEAANVLKANGTRVVAVGVGEVNVDPLRQVSGSVEGNDYFLGGFGSLGASLGVVASQLCGSGLTVLHQVDGIPTEGADYVVEVPEEEVRTLRTAPDGTARLPLEAGRDGITVSGPAGLPLEDVACERGGQSVAATVDEAQRQVTIDVEGIVTCIFSWRGLTGIDGALGAILEGPGALQTVMFDPVPGATAIVTGCLTRESPEFSPRELPSTRPVRCATAELGVSFADGVAVIRHNTCPDCEPPDLLAVTAVPEGVRFRFDASTVVGGAGGLGLGGVDLDLTVGPGSGDQLPSLSGTVTDVYALSVTARQPPDETTCLARFEGGALPILLLPERRPISTGTGC